jgi:hypothetical protein
MYLYLLQPPHMPTSFSYPQTHILILDTGANPPQFLHVSPDTKQQPHMDTQTTYVCPSLTAHPEHTCKHDKKWSNLLSIQPISVGQKVNW